LRNTLRTAFALFTFGALAALPALAADPPSDARKSIVQTALSFKGVPYVYGASSPAAFDCSGFVRYVYEKATGIMVPRTSRALYAAGIPVRPGNAKPGDVLVFDTVGGAPSHVAIVIDDKTMIHAASDGPRTGVIVSSLNDAYFGPRLMGARVFVAESAGAQKKPAPEIPADRTWKRPPPGQASTAEARSDADSVVSTVGFSITGGQTRFTDKIPAAVGTAVQFAVKNETGKDGVFEILFYKMDKDPSKARTIRRDRVRIAAGGMQETEPVLFTEPGQYKLILKTHDNIMRVERVWRVVTVK